MQQQTKKILVRISSAERDRLWNVIFKRYPRHEWGTFIRLGWHESENSIVFTINDINEPEEGDLNEHNWMTEINSQYIRKVVRQVDSHPYAVGFVHSHPENCETYPSRLDDDMETYCSTLLSGYNDRPFVSLIFSKSSDWNSASGRVYFKNQCYDVSRFAIEDYPVTLYDFEPINLLNESSLKRVARLASAFSNHAANRLASATVGIVGLSGTGSPVVELLARAGVGNLVLVDPDVFSDSNLERIHGSYASDIDTDLPKAVLAKRHVLAINPDCNVVSIQGRLPQQEVVDQLLWCDIVVGCTDQHAARIALTELSIRYNVPVMDVGVSMEGKDGKITGQVIQINRLFPTDACVFCRRMINTQIASQELLSDDAVKAKQAEARRAADEKREPNAYWLDVPQLNTVGYLTTMVASLCSGYIIGYLTGRFSMPKNRVELSLTRKGIQLIEKDERADPTCLCQNARGGADQNLQVILTSSPNHWPSPTLHST